VHGGPGGIALGTGINGSNGASGAAGDNGNLG